MRKLLILSSLLLCFAPLKAQEELQFLLISGVEDTKRFVYDYLKPGTEAAMYNLSNGWYHTAEVKNPLGFELSIVGNASLDLGSHQSFFLNTEDYENVQFADGALGKEVSTLFGQNEPGVQVQSLYQNSSGDQQSIVYDLPQGVGEAEVNYFPLAFLQARLGLFKGTEVKARYFPNINYNEVKAGLIGGAIQHEFTSWIPGADLFPVSVAGLVGYTEMNAEYDFTEAVLLEGENQILDAEMYTWVFAAIISTRIPVFNIYGGIGYASGTSETRMRGTYEIVDTDSGENLATLTDPLKVSHEIGGLIANLGISFKLGILKLNADYNLQQYNTVSVGVHVGY